MSLYEEVQMLVEKSKAIDKNKVKEFVDKHTETIISAVKSCAAQGETKYSTSLFNHAPRLSIPFLEELFPPPFKVTATDNNFILIDWTIESLDKPDEDNFGNKRWHNAQCQLHREGGSPPSEWANGTKQWCVNGHRHREGGLPAVEYVNGSKEWWVNGKLHRDGDLPAIERANGTKEWWANGQLYREEK